MKHCNGCDKDKDESDFWLKGNKTQARCKYCQKQYHKQHYIDNSGIYKAKAIISNDKYRSEARNYINSIKDNPCTDCNNRYPYYVMDFDHREGVEKLYNVSNMPAVRASLDEIKNEIAKCDLVCSNCHRIRTHNRMT